MNTASVCGSSLWCDTRALAGVNGIATPSPGDSQTHVAEKRLQHCRSSERPPLSGKISSLSHFSMG